ncbi:MAG: glycosyltransferase, partial [Patescibacteria group bacterium]|nr:glycosyltransferase [Patescibacteria group bacterium]
RLNKTALQKTLGLKRDGDLPIYSVITRLAEQKGVSLIVEAVQAMMRDNRREFVFLGEGEDRYKTELRRLEKTFPGNISFVNRYDTHLARKVYAGSDIFLMPSRFEPCGLTQMIAMRYGTLPVVHNTGGLSDTVVDWRKKTGNGFVFSEFSTSALLACMREAEKTYLYPKLWQALQKRAMTLDFSWHRSAREYLKLYQKLLKY